MFEPTVITRTHQGCEVVTTVDETGVHICLQAPQAKLELEPDPVKDKGINWETGKFKIFRSKHK